MENKNAEYISKAESTENLESEQKRLLLERMNIENRHKNGANWFYWIAGLSLINSIIFLSGSNWNFVIGLGITQLIDGIGQTFEPGIAGKAFLFILDAIAAGVFIVFGILSRKGQNWVFILGMILYAMDGLLFIVVQDWLSIGFHVFALYCIFSGYKASRKIKEMEAMEPVQL